VAGAAGKVKAVHVKAGDTVGEDDVLIEFEWCFKDSHIIPYW
jgi:biotin carboxyl carrier protein